MKIAKSGEAEKLEMNMTPMIDVCFQLIIFFMLSLRLYSPEGDFSIKMPIAAPQEGLPDETQIPPVKIRLRADSHGNLAAIQMGQRMLPTFESLRQQVRDISGMDRGPAGTSSDTEVELDCDYNLKFEYVIDALTAISGYLADDKQTIVRLIEKIRFAPPRSAGDRGLRGRPIAAHGPSCQSAPTVV
jgi:biopolymer transport protein ExbD